MSRIFLAMFKALASIFVTSVLVVAGCAVHVAFGPKIWGAFLALALFIALSIGFCHED